MASEDTTAAWGKRERRRVGLRDESAGVASADGLSVLLCHRCGAVLPAADAVDTMLRKLTQLARFGIGAESGPILTRPRKGV